MAASITEIDQQIEASLKDGVELFRSRDGRAIFPWYDDNAKPTVLSAALFFKPSPKGEKSLRFDCQIDNGRFPYPGKVVVDRDGWKYLCIFIHYDSGPQTVSIQANAAVAMLTAD